MGKVAGVCAICGQTGVAVFRCSVCGSAVCSRCFVQDIKVCKRCLRKGLWVSDRGPE